MLLKTSLALLLLSLALSSGRPKKSEQRAKKEEMLRNGRLDVALKSRDHGFVKPGQGDCPEGWADGTSVGLGCVLPDLNDESVDEPTAETVCKNFGEGGRLVEILNMEQLHFLQNLLGGIENENQMDGYAFWWIGLNDVETEGEFVWPVYGPANFTWWDDYYGEPDDYDEGYDCVEMQSAEFFALAWWTMYCDDTDRTIPVCQLP